MAPPAYPTLFTAAQQDDLLTARALNVAARLPILLGVVLINVVVLASGFACSAPSLLTLWLPLVFAAAIGWRIAYWVKLRGDPASARARRAILFLPLSGLVLAGALVAWALALYGYGNENQRWLVHYVTTVTCFIGVLGMTHSPLTALAMAVTVVVPSSTVFILDHHPGGPAVAGVQAVVGVLLLLSTHRHHRNFVDLEISRLDLARREREASDLAARNLAQATRDALTGALNRRGILEAFEDCLARPTDAHPWLALVDLDGFKLINDTHGHAAGDAVLCAVSERIGQCDALISCGRMGGDEFALLLSGELDRPAIGAVLKDLALAIARPIPFDDRQLAIRASIGLNRCAGSRVSDCIERADLALYKAKANRTAYLGEFTADDERSLADKRTITRAFTSADLANQLAAVYQPIVDCARLRTVGYEALVRWSPNGKDWLPPSDFIHLAETTGRMSELTGMIVRRTLAECPAWEHGRWLSINLSGRDILREGAATWLAGLVDAAGAPHEQIVFEITETALLDDYRRAANTLDQLRSMGFRIALDDFGTGQSSLSHVHNLPLDTLKIDRSFAQGLASGQSARAIVGTIVALARQLRLECVIEGIETAEQEAIARSLGLRMMQGFHFSRPVGALEALRGTLDEWHFRPTGTA